jgi:dTDP-4-dehydrorhamnose 3,5-epimerase-like enzyme
VIQRNIFYDPRGFLVETFALSKEKGKSIYSYNSVTRAGQARDKDQYHFHQHQKDRFTIVRGKMWILLLDLRKKSSTYGLLEVVEAKGADLKIKTKKTVPVYTITIPEGVYHGIMAPGPGEAELVNHPTHEYNSDDEGRISFKEIKIPSLNNATFSWDLVKKR